MQCNTVYSHILPCFVLVCPQRRCLWCTPKLRRCVLQAAADRAAAIALCEAEFWGLLEGQEPPLTPQSSWPALRRQVQTHWIVSVFILPSCTVNV